MIDTRPIFLRRHASAEARKEGRKEGHSPLAPMAALAGRPVRRSPRQLLDPHHVPTRPVPCSTAPARALRGGEGTCPGSASPPARRAMGRPGPAARRRAQPGTASASAPSLSSDINAHGADADAHGLESTAQALESTAPGDPSTRVAEAAAPGAGVFSGYTFALSATGESQVALAHLIAAGGGAVVKIVNSSVDYVVATPLAVRHLHCTRHLHLHCTCTAPPLYLHCTRSVSALHSHPHRASCSAGAAQDAGGAQGTRQVRRAIGAARLRPRRARDRHARRPLTLTQF